MNRALFITTLALIVALVSWTASAYGSLPPSMPAHFGAGGVDRWAETSFWSWFGIPLMAVGLPAVNYGIALAFATRPEYMNIPRKDRLLALPADRRARVMRWWWRLMQVIALVEVLILGVAQYGIWLAAMRRMATGQPIVVLVMILAIAMLPLSIYFVWQMSAEVARQEAARA
jgi:uncharacterized membrane protein